VVATTARAVVEARPAAASDPVQPRPVEPRTQVLETQPVQEQPVQGQAVQEQPVPAGGPVGVRLRGGLLEIAPLGEEGPFLARRNGELRRWDEPGQARAWLSARFSPEFLAAGSRNVMPGEVAHMRLGKKAGKKAGKKRPG